ncbi:PA-phosphatase-like phosphoesterase [Mycolicibacterium aurum]|uniref:PA-phosphatase-like phosphoesterase n=1 Tax=Mycolicibacterium aurum TaxID=1791 RepID=A0A448IGG5_MYCAU|nr:PA-phosphatase [Mycolicibacterium aurum]VEG51519.1 PA-phosphatase-like phosphoesterase [Mycolicibacterium aurum]
MGLIVLGLAVGKGSTPLDDWFQQLGGRYPELGRLLVFTDGRVVLTLWAIVVIVALLQRRWRLAAVAAVTPVVAVMAARLAKRMFGRLKEGEIAYPSGHTTLALVVVATAVLLVGVAMWTVVVAVAVMVLAVIGQAVSYHYFTDTIGALFLGTALVAVTVRAAKLDRCQPEGDVDHSPG